jgi:uncharacterized protein (TIGR00297 family)
MIGLDLPGFLTALVIGFIVYNFGSSSHLALLLLFFFLSLYVTSLGYKEKEKLKLFDYKRGFSNVISNGLFPAIFSLANTPYAFIGSVSAITADKFGSEIGVLGSNPIELFSWKKVNKGKSGAVSFLGLIASFSGSLTISLASAYFFNISPFQVVILSFCGFIGCLADSIAGYFEERGFGNKATSNLVCSFVGGLLGYIILG